VITAPKRAIATVKASIEKTGANEPSIVRRDAFLLAEGEFEVLLPETEAVELAVELPFELALELPEGDVLDGAAAPGAVMDAKLGGVVPFGFTENCWDEAKTLVKLVVLTRLAT